MKRIPITIVLHRPDNQTVGISTAPQYQLMLLFGAITQSFSYSYIDCATTIWEWSLDIEMLAFIICVAIFMLQNIRRHKKKFISYNLW